jgi:hypothetical protein
MTQSSNNSRHQRLPRTGLGRAWLPRPRTSPRTRCPRYGKRAPSPPLRLPAPEESCRCRAGQSAAPAQQRVRRSAKNAPRADNTALNKLLTTDSTGTGITSGHPVSTAKQDENSYSRTTTLTHPLGKLAPQPGKLLWVLEVHDDLLQVALRLVHAHHICKRLIRVLRALDHATNEATGDASAAARSTTRTYVRRQYRGNSDKRGYFWRSTSQPETRMRIPRQTHRHRTCGEIRSNTVNPPFNASSPRAPDTIELTINSPPSQRMAFPT